MNIALVSPYDFSYPGGVVNHISCLEQHFTRMGHKVKIIAPASRAVHTLGDRFIPIGMPRSFPVSGSIARITISPWLGPRVKAVLEREHFDIIHLHEPLMPMLCTTLLRLTPTPAVGTFHASGGKPWYNIGTPIGKLFLNKWVNRLDCRIAVSAPALSYVSKYFPGDYTIVPNGVNCSHFSPDVKPLDEFNDGKLNILFVGRLEKRKGVNYLLAAYENLKREIPNSRLIIVGPGTRLRKKYEQQVQRSRLDDVVFTGYVDYQELPRYFKIADVFCAPAIGWESFGIILLEAMSMGKPIVASHIPGYANVLSHGVEGLLVPPRDSRELARSLMLMLKDETLRKEMSAEGRRKACQYDWRVISCKVMNCYLKVLGQPLMPEEPPLTETPAIFE